MDTALRSRFTRSECFVPLTSQKEEVVQTSQQRYGRMQEMDSSIIIQTMLRGNMAENREDAESRLDAFFQWFSVIPESNAPLQMVELVDSAWHGMILNTELYREFSNEFAGEFIHHDPNDVFSDSQEMKEKYARGTLKRLQAAYGETLNPLLLGLNQKVTCCIGCGGGR